MQTPEKDRLDSPVADAQSAVDDASTHHTDAGLHSAGLQLPSASQVSTAVKAVVSPIDATSKSLSKLAQDYSRFTDSQLIIVLFGAVALTVSGIIEVVVPTIPLIAAMSITGGLVAGAASAGALLARKMKWGS